MAEKLRVCCCNSIVAAAGLEGWKRSHSAQHYGEATLRLPSPCAQHTDLPNSPSTRLIYWRLISRPVRVVPGFCASKSHSNHFPMGPSGRPQPNRNFPASTSSIFHLPKILSWGLLGEPSTQRTRGCSSICLRQYSALPSELESQMGRETPEV